MKLITNPNFEKSRGEIKKAKLEKQKVVFSSDDDELNRKILEKCEIDVLLPSMKSRKDFQKQRNSGFNQVLAKIAKKNRVSIGINFDELIEADKFNKARILNRVRQNVMLCRKNRLKMIFVIQKKENSRNIHDLKALGLVLGMPTWMTKELAIQSFFN